MSAATVLAYGIVFGLGPLVYLMVQRLPAGSMAPGGVMAAVAAALVLALILRERAPLVALLCLWLSWVLAIGLFVAVLRRRAPPPRVARLSLVAGLLATTLPWFGLATAQMVTR